MNSLVLSWCLLTFFDLEKLTADLDAQQTLYDSVNTDLANVQAELVKGKQLQIDVKEDLLKKCAELQDVREFYEIKLKKLEEECGMFII